MIELVNITTGYSKPLLSDFSYRFEDGQIYGILGQSGIGKTTLLKTIAGLIYPLDGLIYVDNQLLRRASKNDIYMMHQNYTCFDWLTCMDNILITEKVKHKKITTASKERAFDILNKVGLSDSFNKYPSQLSGGMRQRLALARTLFVKPKIILMDEPLSALDEKTRKQMQNLIIEIHKETNNTIIMVTHSTEEANLMCDKIINF